jgi:hypothetical protein
MIGAVRPSIETMTVAAGVVVMLVAPAAPAAAQNEDALRSFFEGKHVTVKIDMPGTSDGIDVRLDATRSIDYKRYGERLKDYGTAIRAGDSAIVTLVKVKSDLIEFQLSGGGFGTFGDDTSTSVNIKAIEKSSREKELEKQVKAETDSHRRRELQDELDEQRDRRERENRRIDDERVRAEERKKERIVAERLHGGSRFNLRFQDSVPNRIRPEDVMAALAEYVDFLPASPGEGVSPDARPAADVPPARPVADTTQPRKGMMRAEAERAFGKPIDSSDRREGGIVITTLVFVSGGQRIAADFLEDVLVRYTITSR